MGFAQSVSCLATVLMMLSVGEGVRAHLQGRVFFWGLTDANKTRTCILLTGLFEILVPYETDHFTKAVAIIPVPRNASVNGFCDNDSNHNLQSMTLTWAPDPRNLDVKHTLTVTFKRTIRTGEDDPYYYLSTIQGVIQTNDVEFRDAFDYDVYELKASNVQTIIASEGLSYYCKSTQVIKFDDGENSIGMSFVHAEAFHKSIALGDQNDFGPKSFCIMDGFQVILRVLMYIIVLALISLAVFYIMDKRGKRYYTYL